MTFLPEERKALLVLKGVGPVVLGRLEQMGIASLAQLAAADANDIVSRAARLSASSCWKNSPQARAAIEAAIALARRQRSDGNGNAHGSGPKDGNCSVHKPDCARRS